VAASCFNDIYVQRRLVDQPLSVMGVGVDVYVLSSER
jgi:hypothetical protein